MLLGGLLHAPVSQRMTARTEQSQVIRLERTPQAFASSHKVVPCFIHAGEDRRSHFDLALEHLIGETSPHRRLARFNRSLGWLIGHAPGVQIGDEVFLFNAEPQLSVHGWALSDSPLPLRRAETPRPPLFANRATLAN
ncbi:hypothetical protein D3C72_1677910 [compost metagenome]